MQTGGRFVMQIGGLFDANTHPTFAVSFIIFFSSRLGLNAPLRAIVIFDGLGLQPKRCLQRDIVVGTAESIDHSY
jgi:hypothetical protein